MAAQEDELKSLKEKNNELVQKVQYWKMTAAQRENEKLELMKEVNELRLKLIRLKSSGAADARKLDAALQAAGAAALSHLVEASGAVARALELAKGYTREREGAAAASPRWSSISNSAEKVHRVPPLMIGGQSIQPVVSLSRAAFNVNTNRQTSRSPNSTRNVTVRAVPMHMLQDVYIPLTRIDTRDLPNTSETEPEPADDSAEDMPFDASMEDVAEESQNITDDDYDSSRRLDVVAEDAEPEPEPEGEGEGEGEQRTPPRLLTASPLAGPSWRADAGPGPRRSPAAAAAPAPAPAPALTPAPAPGPRRRALEPDSTTADTAPKNQHTPEVGRAPSPSPSPSPPARVFTPTVRRRKRSATPPTPTPPEPSRDSAQLHTPNGLALCSRVLQVLLPKLPAGAGDAPAAGAADAAGAARTPGRSPRKRRAPAPRFDAPSPNGATERGIVSEEVESPGVERRPVSPRAGAGAPARARDRGDRARDGAGNHSRGTESWRRHSDDSDSGAELAGEGRTRRPRRPVTYKEKPLNRKLRR